MVGGSRTWTWGPCTLVLQISPACSFTPAQTGSLRWCIPPPVCATQESEYWTNYSSGGQTHDSKCVCNVSPCLLDVQNRQLFADTVTISTLYREYTKLCLAVKRKKSTRKAFCQCCDCHKLSLNNVPLCLHVGWDSLHCRRVSFTI